MAIYFLHESNMNIIFYNGTQLKTSLINQDFYRIVMFERDMSTTWMSSESFKKWKLALEAKKSPLGK